MTKTGTIGYIGSFPIPEVVSGINAFHARRPVGEPERQDQGRLGELLVRPGKEADAAKALLDQGVDVLAQHTDSPAPLQTAEERGKLGFGQASDMERFAPKAQLTAIVDDWGALLRRAGEGGPRRHLEIRGHLARLEGRDGRHGAVQEHAGRREEDRRRD